MKGKRNKWKRHKLHCIEDHLWSAFLQTWMHLWIASRISVKSILHFSLQSGILCILEWISSFKHSLLDFWKLSWTLINWFNAPSLLFWSTFNFYTPGTPCFIFESVLGVVTSSFISWDTESMKLLGVDNGCVIKNPDELWIVGLLYGITDNTACMTSEISNNEVCTKWASEELLKIWWIWW